MIKKCFTINQFRTPEEIQSYAILLKQNLYQGIEIFYPYDSDISSYTKAITELNTNQCEVVMHLPYGPKNDLCNPDTYLEAVKRIKEAIDYSKQFKIDKHTLHLGYLHGNREDNINKLIHILKDLCDYCEGILMIENMPSNNEIGYSPEEIYEIINRVGKDNLRFILDTGHANLSEYQLDDYLSLLKKYLCHLHLSDNNGLQDEHQRIGTGNIDFKSLIKNLQDYQNLFCLEILYRDVNDLIMYSNDLDKIILEVENEKS